MKRLTAATLFGMVLIPSSIMGEDQTKDAKAMNEPQIRFLNRAPAGYSQVVVKQLFRPELLVEVDAIAVAKD